MSGGGEGAEKGEGRSARAFPREDTVDKGWIKARKCDEHSRGRIAIRDVETMAGA